MARLISTQSLVGKRVVGGKQGTQRIGKVRCCIFHPEEKRCVGFMVKRPDVALMFHRSNLFVPLGGYQMADGAIVLSSDSDEVGRAAARKAGIDVEACVVWSGLPVMSPDGEKFGYVGAVVFDEETGAVDSVIVSGGAASSAMLGTVRVPASMVGGFCTGMGEPLLAYGEVDDGDDADPSMLGALVVSPEVAQLESAGGVAEQAGHATAVVADKVETAVAAAKPKVETAVAAAKPKVDSAAKAAEGALHAGAYATGRQLARSKGMFAAFKEEFAKAAQGDDAGEDDGVR